MNFSGNAIVFESEESSLRGILDGQVKAGHVVVIRNEGPVGHKDQVALCDVSILKPDITKKNSLNFEYLEILAKKHRDLFDHPVISAMIW